MSIDDSNFGLAQDTHDELRSNINLSNEAAVKSGESAIKMAILANGGAVIAVLSFLGSIASSDKITVAQIASVANSLLWFAGGVATGLGCMFFAYLTNLSHANYAASHVRLLVHPYIKAGSKTRRYSIASNIFHTLAILLGASSLCLFVGGVWDVRTAILEMAGTIAG